MVNSTKLYNGVTNEMIPAYLYQRLPESLHPFLLEYKGRERDVVFVSALGAISSCLPNIAGYYDKRLFYANLYVMVSAPAASGKGVLNKARLFVNPIHKKLIADSVSKIKKWKEDQKEKKNEGPKPEMQIKILAGDTSSSQMYAYMKSSPNGLFMIETEADTIGNMLQNDWSSYSPILRSAFQHEPLSVVRKDNETFIEIENPKLSLLMSGTPEQFKNIIKSKENGLFSRFLVYSFDDIQDFKNVFEKSDADPDKSFKDFAEQLHTLYGRLQNLSKPILFELTENQQKKFVRQFRKIEADIVEKHPHGFISNIKRYALIQFKISMILSAIRNLNNLPEMGQLVCSNSDFLVAEKLTSIFIKHALIVYYSFDSSVLSDMDEQILFALKSPFTRQEAVLEAQKLGMPLRTLDDKLKKWKSMKIIHSVGHGKYRRDKNHL